MGLVKNGLMKYVEEELGISCAKIQLDYSNYVYHQDEEYDLVQEGIGVVEDYDDWAGNEDNCCMVDEAYNRFTWLVAEGEEVYEGQHIATIKTKEEEFADEYWAILVASNDGFIHKEIKDGKHAMDSKERAATIYYSMEDYDEEVLKTGQVAISDSLIKKCSNCGTLHSGNKKFCGECGDKLIKDEMKCTICGAKIEDKQKYCYECGTKVR